MKAITLWEPWASLIALGAKKIETRSWPTSYRGPLAIHSGLKKLSYYPIELVRAVPAVVTLKYHYGCVIAIANLVACIEMTPANIALVDEPERSFGDYAAGRWMWLLANVRRIDPVPAKGRLRLWEWNGHA